MRILLVDDSAELLDLVERALVKEGHEVITARSLALARARLLEGSPDVIVLDLELPDGTGLDLCRALRKDGVPVPILLLTAHGEVPQRVAGLDAGADDFLAKPFALAELRARVRALGRRGPRQLAQIVQLGAIALDVSARRALSGDNEIPITAREWAVIEVLLGRAGQVVSRQAILESVWGESDESASASLDVIMARIRRKLGAGAVRTVRGEGYALELG